MEIEQEFVPVDHTRHNVKGFRCDKPVMDEFLARYAVKNRKLGLSTTWVLPTKENPHPHKTTIAAYFTLASSTISREQIPTDQALPKYPVPVVLLARFAVDERFKGRRLGEKTLITALRKSVQLTERGLPCLGLILDVLDEEALGYYRRYEIFKPFTDDPMRLFVSMHLLKQI